MQNEQTEQTEQQAKEAIAKLLTSTNPYRYNDADQREAGFDNDDYRS